jgi:hypothetical protein
LALEAIPRRAVAHIHTIELEFVGGVIEHVHQHEFVLVSK